MKELLLDKMDSEIGVILLVIDSDRLCALDFADREDRMMHLLGKRYQNFCFDPVKNPLGYSERIKAYLKGDYSSVDNIPVHTGGTSFQQQVWSVLCSISPGSVVSYAQLAQKLGKPKAYRAVGMACSLNPIAIAIPCHRVVGTKGRLRGYAGGLTRKRWLLHHEGIEREKPQWGRTLQIC